MPNAPKVVRAIAATPLTQTRTYFENLYGGVIARLFLSTQYPLPNAVYHDHEGEQFIVALEGESRIESIRGHGVSREHNTLQTVRAGDVVVLAARKPHRWITPRGELLALAIDLCSPSSPYRTQNPGKKDFEALVSTILGPGEPETLHGLLKGGDAFAQLLREYRREAELQRPGMTTRVGALCVEMLVLIARKRANAPAVNPNHGASVKGAVPARISPQHYVERAREFLQADYRRDVALPELAERIGLSVTHLHRLFVEHLKLPPMAYLRQFRMERAGELLTQTSRPVREIARDVGYPEPEQFSKVFRRAYGCSPRDYRQSALRQAPAPL